jgi:hypothetical protein
MKHLINVKPITLPALLSAPALRLAMGVLFFLCVSQGVSANESESLNGGRLIIKRSVVLGHNVSVSIYIDGKPAGTLRRNHDFEKFLTPGRHTLLASPNRSRGEWQTTLNVRAGETYSYTASYNVNKIVLTPATASR